MSAVPHPQCKQCNRPLNKRQKQYCSYTCKWEGSKETLKLTCRFCGKGFELYPSVFKKQHGLEFCAKECELAFSDREIKVLRAAGIPLLSTVSRDVIKCNVCGLEGRNLGIHFATRHGINARGLNKFERAIVFGIGLGERTVAPSLRDEMVQRGDAGNFGDSRKMGGVLNIDYQRQADLRALFPVPVAVTETCLRNSLNRHEEACRRKQLGLPPIQFTAEHKANLSAKMKKLATPPKPRC